MDALEIRVALTGSQAEKAQQRIAALPFKIGYREEQRGVSLVARIECTPAQEPFVREIIIDIGATISPLVACNGKIGTTL